MKYVYIDESGDFGFSKKSTKVVIVAASFTKNQKYLSVWLKRTKRRKLLDKKSKTNELKASVQDESFLEYFYKHAISDLKFSVYAIVIDKQKIPQRLKNEEGLIYFKAIEKLVEISKPGFSKNMIWCFDRRSLKKLSWKLLQAEIRTKLVLSLDADKSNIEVHPVDSQRVINIQFADFVAYAIFRSKEFGDNRWINIIKPNIRKVVTLKFN